MKFISPKVSGKTFQLIQPNVFHQISDTQHGATSTFHSGVCDGPGQSAWTIGKQCNLAVGWITLVAFLELFHSLSYERDLGMCARPAPRGLDMALHRTDSTVDSVRHLKSSMCKTTVSCCQQPESHRATATTKRGGKTFGKVVSLMSCDLVFSLKQWGGTSEMTCANLEFETFFHILDKTKKQQHISHVNNFT